MAIARLFALNANAIMNNENLPHGLLESAK